MHNKGQYLKEATFDFLIAHKFSQEEAKFLIQKIVKLIKTEIISQEINDLPPGFDILTGIKESCIYLGYWYEYDFIHIIVSSCSNFDENLIKVAIVEFFLTELASKIKLILNQDTTILNLIKSL